ncbi:hypothetical protein [Actinoplanes utahensis]|uniref:Uncharacterized protein n=1 Tax=Actinoplanes utahensis TaxID=1869 RepID=A0A0A6UGT4_ACTUT|nr:hypothetical protein [Actinoplanes utahensis]KHD73534.1 hypothetical protein MB27_33845 [Actinoplanes utahensis]GIF33851.1 hypothetical protein Aut01nite_68370 [Actinoplanes utahensis]
MEHRQPDEVGEQTATLLRLSLELRTAAADADRQDVVERVDALMRLIAGERVLSSAGSQKTNGGVAETVQRILNGLGF